MAYSKIRQPKLSDVIEQQLEFLILEGTLRPGEKLPPERELAKQFDVSYRHRYAREKGLGNLFIGKISLQQTLTTLAIAIALATALLGLQGLRAALIALVLIGGLGWALKRTLGGQTGDTLGAAIELGEVFFLLALL